MLIVIEGPDGVGKNAVADALARNIDAGRLDFPDRTTSIGREIAACLRGEIKLTPLALQSLMLANRLEHRTLLNADRRLVIVRYWQSAIVYGGLDGLDADLWENLNRAGLPFARHNVLLTVPIHIVSERCKARQKEFYDDQHAQARDAYAKLWSAKAALRNSTEQWQVVDNSGPVGDAVCAIEKLVLEGC